MRVFEEFAGFYIKKGAPDPSITVRHFCGKVQFTKSGVNESDALDLAAASGMTDTSSIRSIPRKRKFKNDDASSSSTSDAASNDDNNGPDSGAPHSSDRPTNFENAAPYQVSTVSKRARA